VVQLRPPPWDWSAFEDGNLALDRHEVWEEAEEQSRFFVSRTPVPTTLQKRERFVSVRRVPASRPQRRALAARREKQRAARRATRIAVVTLVAAALVATLLVTAFGAGTAPPLVQASAAAGGSLPNTARPAPEIVATRGTLRLQLPVSQSQLTAIGYSTASDGALALSPLGRQGNAGLLDRLKHKIFGGGHGSLVWYQLAGGGAGPATGSLSVGAAPGTDVYAPVDGTVVGITRYILDGRTYGVRIDLQPANAPSLVVSLTHVAADPAVTVGYAVAAGTSKLGTLLDLSHVERQTLARYTQDAGNHVTVEVRPAATLTLP
jgi:hypothetical protein